MPHDISATASGELDKDNLIYTEIYKVVATGTTLHLSPTPPTASGSAIAFTLGGDDYTSFGITRSAVRSSADGTVDGLSISFQNVDQELGALILANEDGIREGTVTISGVFLDPDDNTPISDDPADMRWVFEGTVGALKIKEDTIEMRLSAAIKDIRVDVPRRFYSQPLFPFTVGRV
jgi:hypothetical protein